jgi:hypothetical protein
MIFTLALKTLNDDSKLRLLFVTGVTKFVLASIFSVFNNLADLTFNPRYNAICGFTLEEIYTYFTEYLPYVLDYNKSKGLIPPDADIKYLKNEIKNYYDGYSWDGELRVYNPLTLVRMFVNKEIASYWFDTGTPSILFDFLKLQICLTEFPKKETNDKFELNAVDIKELKLNMLMFQTGYLTAKKIYTTLRLPFKMSQPRG